ncbi:ankyrin repeat-containing domain protein [Bisporella sp. PMI_857]|nr:ankyrin repeat-containing domain protein [Bisporella sp. PMI_857]
MPPPKISQEEWERHKSAINDLYIVRGLPLDKGAANVAQEMRNVHGFAATEAQYEAQIRKWEMSKNLKKHEWRQILAITDKLESRGFETRVKVSGVLMSVERIKRVRRHVRSNENVHARAAEDISWFQSRGVVIETRKDGEEWSSELRQTAPPSIANGDANHDTALDNLMVTSIEPSLVLSRRHTSRNLDYSDSFGSNPEFLLPRSSFTATNDNALYQSNNNDFGYLDYSFESPFPCPNPFAFNSPPFFQLQSYTFTDWGTFDLTHQADERVAAYNLDSTLAIKSLNSPRELVGSILRDAESFTLQISKPLSSIQLPDPEDLLDRLESLLPDNPGEVESNSGFDLITKDAVFDSPFHKSLLYSIVNGFAGFEGIPLGSVLRILRSQQHISTQLFESLRTSPPIIAKSLADNLFRAAVEGEDAQVVRVILETMRNTPNAIDPNSIICQMGGRDYTPIEMAAKFRNLEIVTLLAPQSDVNKTYGENPYGERGALELAVRISGTLEQVDQNLVRILLDCRAEIRLPLVESIARRAPDGHALLQMVLPQIEPSVHRDYFGDDSILPDIVKYAENSVADEAIRYIFNLCQQAACEECYSDCQNLIEETLTLACLRGNIKLTQYLLDYASATGKDLSAAVRSGNRELINLLLQRGAGMDCEAYCLERLTHSKYDPNFRPLTTPLAESIRLKDGDLVQRFMDGWNQVTWPDHFEAAICAAAEVGNYSLMQTLLGKMPEEFQERLESALYVAIHNDDTEAAFLLLNSGASVEPNDYGLLADENLYGALKRRNKAVVDVILDCDVNFARTGFRCIDAAVQWGDARIIQDLILMGAPIDAGQDATALTMAIKSRNKQLVETLLKHGANPNAKASSGASPLEAAIISRDHKVLHMLISSGADLADTAAFLYAVKHDKAALESLLSLFVKKYPLGRKGFGAIVLKDAIKRQDAEILRRLLVAKLDTNSFLEATEKEANHFPWPNRSKTMTTLLGFAIQYQKGQCIDLVQSLLRVGADPNSIVVRAEGLSVVRNIFLQMTALMVAIETRNDAMVRLLLRSGADVNRAARQGLKYTPLQYACALGSFRMVKLLIEENAEVNGLPAARGGGTALQMASMSGSIKIVRLLLKNGAFIHAPGSKGNGRSAFGGAAEHGRLGILKELWIASGGGIGLTSKEFARASSLAKAKGHRGCVDYIASLASASNAGFGQGNLFIDFNL